MVSEGMAKATVFWQGHPLRCGSPGITLVLMRNVFLIAAVALVFISARGTTSAQSTNAPLQGDALPTAQGNAILHPVNHSTVVLGWNALTIYTDPVGDATRFEGLPLPQLILITDIHGDHFNVETLKRLVRADTRLVAPQAVADQLPAEWRDRLTILTNAQTASVCGVGIEAIPMYNTTPERQQYHPKGRGNGYVLTLADKRVYLSGDTEDIPEMRTLKGIDAAFVCMNLPYTMTVDQAASAVKAFKPKTVYPYHYRGSDLERFRRLLADEPGITVRIVDWYRP
jgi:L-ascorbate metabolism protein UlaG (beta-lactamase superfamily)